MAKRKEASGASRRPVCDPDSSLPPVLRKVSRDAVDKMYGYDSSRPNRPSSRYDSFRRSSSYESFRPSSGYDSFRPSSRYDSYRPSYERNLSSPPSPRKRSPEAVRDRRQQLRGRTEPHRLATAEKATSAGVYETPKSSRPDVEARLVLRTIYPRMPQTALDDVLRTSHESRKFSTVCKIKDYYSRQVENHVRHQWTNYDDLVRQFGWLEARRLTQHRVDLMKASWGSDVASAVESPSACSSQLPQPLSQRPTQKLPTVLPQVKHAEGSGLSTRMQNRLREIWRWCRGDGPEATARRDEVSEIVSATL